VIFLIRCGRNPVIYDEHSPPLQLSISFFNSIPHFSTFWFSPWSKKILRISPANLGKNPSRGQESLLSTLDIQMGISWVFDIEIEWFKTPNSSTCTGLQLWWRIQSEINSFWITELQPKLGWKPFRGRILCFHARFQTWISWAFDIEIKQFKSSNSSTCPRLQLWWRIRSKIKSFWITESGGNLVGQKGSPGLI